MIVLLLAVALTACYAAAVYGSVLLRDQGPLGRFGDGDAALDGGPRARRDPLAGAMEGLAVRFGPRAMRLVSPARERRIRERIDAAGRPDGMTVETYAGRKAAHACAMGLAGLLFLLRGNPLIAVALPLIGFFFLDVWLYQRGRRRQEEIDRALPDFLDILAVSVSAGVGFLAALRRITEITPGPLGAELTTTLTQMDFGSSRREAFRDLRARNRSESLAKFVTALLQAEELGVPLTETLADLARDMRRFFYQQARQRAAKAAPRVSLVVTLVVVPGAVILIIAAFLFGSSANLGGIGG